MEILKEIFNGNVSGIGSKTSLEYRTASHNVQIKINNLRANLQEIFATKSAKLDTQNNIQMLEI